jgi:hypothetical protein
MLRHVVLTRTIRRNIPEDTILQYKIQDRKMSKIWGFHGCDYEECRLLGYKTPFRTSQETRYVSATESSQLMLCKIWGFHGDDYEECRLLGCDVVQPLYEPIGRTYRLQPPAEKIQQARNNISVTSRC